MIIPLPSPDCVTDWNYNFHGMDWVCKCNEGLEQSPIDLPDIKKGIEIRFNLFFYFNFSNNADFDYKDVQSGKINVVYENNMIRLKTISTPS